MLRIGPILSSTTLILACFAGAGGCYIGFTAGLGDAPDSPATRAAVAAESAAYAPRGGVVPAEARLIGRCDGPDALSIIAPGEGQMLLYVEESRHVVITTNCSRGETWTVSRDGQGFFQYHAEGEGSLSSGTIGGVTGGLWLYYVPAAPAASAAG